MALSMSVSGGAVNARHDLDPEYRARLQNVNLPDGGDLNDGSTGAATASPAQQAHVQDRSIERSVGFRER